MNKAVNYFKIYFKNGLKNYFSFYAIFLLLYSCLMVVCSVFFYVIQEQKIKLIKTVYLPWLIVMFLIILSILLYVSFLYNNKNFRILKTYISLGAKKLHIIICILLENINIYLLSILIGFFVVYFLFNPSSIENIVAVTNFFNNILIVLAVSVLNSIINNIFVYNKYQR